MNAFEIWHEGQRIGTAGLENGIVNVSFLLWSRDPSDPVWLDARGRNRQAGGHAQWLHRAIDIGDEFTIKLVDTPPA